jgi:hypothetical protein
VLAREGGPRAGASAWRPKEGEGGEKEKGEKRKRKGEKEIRKRKIRQEK